MPKRECSHAVHARILEFCNGPRNVRSIMESCSLSGATVYENVRFLLDRGFLEKIEVPKLPKPLFITTLKGYRYLKLYEKLEKLLESEV